MFKRYNSQVTKEYYLDQKVGLMASCTSWTVEINGGGFLPACAPTLKSVQVQREEVKVLEQPT
jgi:hypothetical protein